MRTAVIPSKSSTGSTTTTAMEDDDRSSENRDSCYYPGCRKDANCNCNFCLESINATLDLMPLSIQKSSLTKLSASRPDVERTPISFDASVLSTPKSDASYTSSSPVLESNARSNLNGKIEKEKKKKRDLGFCRVKFFKLVLSLGLIFAGEVVFPWVVSRVFQPLLSPDVMRKASQKSRAVQDLNAKLRFLQNELSDIVHGKVFNCNNSSSSEWKISQDGVLLNSRCTLYKSAAEEVAIWGWPLQTAGLLTTGFSSSSFTILSGRVTEWNGGQVGFLIRKANTSWVQPKWGASVVQLDPNTWVLEYRRNSFFDNSRLYSAVLEFFKYRISRAVQRVKKEFWLSSAFGDNQCNAEFTANYGTKIPT
ncbi:putative C-8 sterol isomerase [Senna tora]|uniref:Putative C-8 sterol isomerase n=1 Tax=Senna tora TaxID=362788 RepID=A0A834X2K2_9FABA|nr:putative C-8 sterol isomerase [Senna tora]